VCVSVFQATPAASSLPLAAAHISNERLARHLGIVLSNTITSMIATGELCPELNELGFKIDKVATSAPALSFQYYIAEYTDI